MKQKVVKQKVVKQSLLFQTVTVFRNGIQNWTVKCSQAVGLCCPYKSNALQASRRRSCGFRWWPNSNELPYQFCNLINSWPFVCTWKLLVKFWKSGVIKMVGNLQQWTTDCLHMLTVFLFLSGFNLNLHWWLTRISSCWGASLWLGRPGLPSLLLCQTGSLRQNSYLPVFYLGINRWG